MEQSATYTPDTCQQSLMSSITPDLIIHPSGHTAFCRDMVHEDPVLLVATGAGMPKDNNGSTLSLDVFQVLRPVIQNYYKTLPSQEKKKLDGLEGFELATVLEDMFEESMLTAFQDLLPVATQRKLAKLDNADRLTELRKMKIKATEDAYSSEKAQASKTAAYIKANMIPEQGNLFAPYPHEIARRSPFFIDENSERFNKGKSLDSKEETKTRPYLERLPIGAGPWGYTVFSGKKLFTTDEKAYVILLGLAAKQKKNGVVDWHIVSNSIRNFLRESKLPENGFYTARFVDGVQAMHEGVFRFEGKDLKKGSSMKKRPLKERLEGWHLVSNYTIDNVTGDFVVTLDRAFIETFVGEFSMYANMNIELFCSLPPTASAIYRFYNSHMPDMDGCKRFNMLLVAKVTNLITPSDYPDGIETDEWPSPQVKGKKKVNIDRALKRLIADKCFGPKTCILTRKRGEDDMVVVEYLDQKKINSVMNRHKQVHHK